MAANKTKSLGILLATIAVAMLGFSYALVPIYNIICGKFAITGKLGEPAASLNKGPIDTSRWVNMEFTSTDYTNGPLEFEVLTPAIKVHPGENASVNFRIKNKSNRLIVMRTMPSVTPGIAAKYFKRIDCFCFHLQTLKSKEITEMSLFFYIDGGLPKNIHNITVSYALYDAKK